MRALTRWRGGARPSATPLSRRFTYRYIVAIVLFAAIGLAAKITNDQAMSRLEANAQQLRAAASQPSRVYNILEITKRVEDENLSANPSAEDLRVLETELRQEIDILEDIERSLSAGTGTPTLPAVAPNDDLRELYTGSQTRLDQKVKDVANAGQLVADFSAPGTDGNTRRVQVNVLRETIPPTADLLDEAVRLYSVQTREIIADQRTSSTILVATALGAMIFVVGFLFRPMAQKIHDETSQLAEAERLHREGNERQTFRNDLSRALEVTDDKAEVLAAVARAMQDVIPGNQAELLLADSSQTHLRRAQGHPTRGPARCPVDSPKSCAALRSTQRMEYSSSRLLNVCPKLPEHAQSPCSAVCVPVTFNGQAMGVLHAIGPDGQPFDQERIDRLTVLATETGTRLGQLQVVQMTELQATTDGLTGLLNRRSLDARARAMLVEGRQFSVAMGDLDNFKDLNDTFGHESGDRALRIFARSLKRHLRPDDIAARYGGEEFVVLLPDTTIAEAMRALERLRGKLAEDIGRSGGAGYTVSWGVTDTGVGSSFEEMLAVADSALYAAKKAGKDRIVGDAEMAVRSDELPDELLDEPHLGGFVEGSDEEDLLELDFDLLQDGSGHPSA
jgi:diguanylate cyclase (GGDEF)-like protein